MSILAFVKARYKVFTFPHIFGKVRFLNKFFKRRVLKNPRLINHFIKEHYDVNIGFLEGISTIYISQKRGGRKVGYIHTSLFEIRAGRRDWREVRAYLELDSIICVSHSAKASLLRLYPELGAKHIEVIYNPIDKDKIWQKAAQKPRNLQPFVAQWLESVGDSANDSITQTQESPSDCVTKTIESPRDCAMQTQEVARDSIKTLETLRDCTTRTIESPLDSMTKKLESVRDSMARMRESARDSTPQSLESPREILTPHARESTHKSTQSPAQSTPHAMKGDSIMPPRDFTKTPFVFLQVGRLTYQKGLITLLEANKILQKQGGLDYEIWLLGDGARYRAELEALITAQGVANVRFLGFNDNPYYIMARCDCIVLASYFEGYGLVLAEACVLGKTIISSDIPTSKEVLTSDSLGECAVFFESKNAKDLSQKMRQIYESPSLRENLAQKAAQKARDFDIARATRAFEHVIRGEISG